MTIQTNNQSITLLAVVASVALVIFGFRPALNHYHTQRVQVAAAKQEQAALMAAQSQIIRLGQEIESHADAAKLLSQAVPSDAQIPELVSQVVGLAQSAGVTLLTIQPIRTKGMNDLVVTLSVQGSFLGIIGLAERLEQNIRPVTVQSVNIVKTVSTGDLLTATLKVNFAQAAPATGGQ